MGVLLLGKLPYELLRENRGKTGTGPSSRHAKMTRQVAFSAREPIVLATVGIASCCCSVLCAMWLGERRRRLDLENEVASAAKAIEERDDKLAFMIDERARTAKENEALVEQVRTELETESAKNEALTQLRTELETEGEALSVANAGRRERLDLAKARRLSAQLPAAQVAHEETIHQLQAELIKLREGRQQAEAVAEAPAAAPPADDMEEAAMTEAARKAELDRRRAAAESDSARRRARVAERRSLAAQLEQRLGQPA